MSAEDIIMNGIDFRNYNDVSILEKFFGLNDSSTKEALYNI